MRETTLLAIAAAAALIGMGLGHWLLPKRPAAVAAEVVPTTTNVLVEPVTKIALQTTPPEPVDPNSTPEAIHAWRRQDKDEIEQRVDRLSNADAEHLCFVLQLIPRDEVFDHVNVKGRLKRHIDEIQVAAEFADVEAAFRDLDRLPQ
ncbi:MAG: hypothetical protein P4L99_06295 [Chthoniobacter sp.]|nr:hypothetical protein [Chthoniobacter sp.]